MKLLLCAAAVNNRHITQQFLDSIVHQRHDILLCANGPDTEIRELFQEYSVYPSIKEIIWEPENIYVNRAWDKFMKYFLDHPEYTHIIILNNDLILQHDFFRVLYKINLDQYIPLPTQVNKDEVKLRVDPNGWHDLKVIQGGYPGICLILNRQAVNYVYPIPEEIKVFYGDDWVLDLCRAHGYKTAVFFKLQVFHEGSQSVNSVSGVQDMIQQDHTAWKDSVKPLLEKRIKLIKNPEAFVVQLSEGSSLELKQNLQGDLSIVVDDGGESISFNCPKKYIQELKNFLEKL